MKIRRLLAIGALALLAPLATSCGDDGNDTKNPPSVSDMSKSLQDNADLPKAQADCVAEALEKDDSLNPELLNAVANDNKTGVDEDEEAKVTAAVQEAAVACATAGN